MKAKQIFWFFALTKGGMGFKEKNDLAVESY